MCTKEIAALATVLLLALATAVSMVSLAGFATWFQPREVPAKSALANFQWESKNSVHNITNEQLQGYEARGFQVFRQVIDPKAIELLLAEAKRLCTGQFWVSRVCQIEEGRWQSDVIRDFLFYSNVSAIASSLIRDSRTPPLRVYQDGIVGVTSSWLQPLFYTFTKHVDHGGVPGIWHGLHSDTLGVGLWIPLVEVDPDVTGGGIELYNKFPQHGCQLVFGERSTVDGFDATINMSKVYDLCKRHKQDNATVKPKVKPGDVVAWWPQMMHKTQPVKQNGFVRYALYVRLVSNETMLCMQKDCGWKGRPCCSAALPKSGTMIKTPCYPQVYPKPLEQEVKAHFSKKPQPLIDRKKVVSKYSTDIWGSMHAVCKKHRQGGPKRFWENLKNEAPLPDRTSPITLNATEFSCANAKHEGSCWVLDKEGLRWDHVPWFLYNDTQYGVPMFFTMDLEDVERMYRVPWGANVRAEEVDHDWLRVGDYYVRVGYFGALFRRADFLDRSGSMEEASGGQQQKTDGAAKAAGADVANAEEPSASAASTHAEL